MPQHAYEAGAFLFNAKKKTARITAYVLNKLFIIRLNEETFQQSPCSLKKFLRLLGRLEGTHEEASECEGDTDDPLQDLYDWVLEPFLPAFALLRQDEPELAQVDYHYTFADWLFPDTRRCTVAVSEEDRLAPVYLAQEQEQECTRNPDVATNFILDQTALDIDVSMFPIYSPQEVKIPASTGSLPAVPRKVLVKGQPGFLKVVWAGDARAAIREVSKYAKMHAAGFDDSVYTSKLIGLVHDGNGCAVGLLLNYIDCGDGGPLDYINVVDPRYSRLKQKWYDQIEGALRELHSHGIVWGDAAATNVLIDRETNAYLVDFGGGFTPGWVEREEANSLQEDLQGLERIRRFLFG
ncbi:hypothetical protein BJY00DRAFT_307117 [Aspergillus carlsbadensis]|nr:hypothetical protein BJY00DRAFT_307117 [Aspergillus carlsbadensis]